MPERSVTHATFVVERVYPATPARVFAAGPMRGQRRAGSGRRKKGSTNTPSTSVSAAANGARAATPNGGRPIPMRRITSTSCRANGSSPPMRCTSMARAFSVSLGTVELKPEGKGTRLKYTEQGAFLDGFDQPELREKGTADLLDALGRDIDRSP